MRRLVSPLIEDHEPIGGVSNQYRRVGILPLCDSHIRSIRAKCWRSRCPYLCGRLRACALLVRHSEVCGAIELFRGRNQRIAPKLTTCPTYCSGLSADMRHFVCLQPRSMRFVGSVVSAKPHRPVSDPYACLKSPLLGYTPPRQAWVFRSACTLDGSACSHVLSAAPRLCSRLLALSRSR